MKNTILNSMIGLGGFFIGYSFTILFRAMLPSYTVAAIMLVIGIAIVGISFRALKKNKV